MSNRHLSSDSPPSELKDHFFEVIEPPVWLRESNSPRRDPILRMWHFTMSVAGGGMCSLDDFHEPLSEQDLFLETDIDWVEHYTQHILSIERAREVGLRAARILLGFRVSTTQHRSKHWPPPHMTAAEIGSAVEEDHVSRIFPGITPANIEEMFATAILDSVELFWPPSQRFVTSGRSLYYWSDIGWARYEHCEV